MGLQKRRLVQRVFQVVRPLLALGGHAPGQCAVLRLPAHLGFPVVVLGADAAGRQLARCGDLGGQPCGVHDAQVWPLQCHGQRAQKRHDGGALTGRRAGKGCVFVVVGRQAGIEVPPGAIFGVVAQQVDLVVADHGHGAAAGHQVRHPREHRRAVGAPVAKVAHKDQRAAIRVPPLGVVAQVGQQRVQRVDFAMDVADDVERSRGQVLDEAHAVRGLWARLLVF